MLVRRMVGQHEFRDDAQTALMCFLQKLLEVAERAIHRMHVAVIRYVIAVVLEPVTG